VGSALNDTVQELGAAFGVAVLGSILAAAYRSHLAVGVPKTARRSLGETLGVAQAAGPGRPGLATAARAAFDTAMHHSLLVGAGVAVLGAVVGWRFIGTAAAAAGGDPATGAAERADQGAEAAAAEAVVAEAVAVP
jgi:hypothetical protein